MKMTENDIIAAYVKSRYPNLIKTADYNTFAAAKRIGEAFEAIKGIFKPEPYADLNDLIRKVNEEAEREQKYGRYEEGSSDGSAEAPDGIRGEESICEELITGHGLCTPLQED